VGAELQLRVAERFDAWERVLELLEMIDINRARLEPLMED